MTVRIGSGHPVSCECWSCRQQVKRILDAIPQRAPEKAARAGWTCPKCNSVYAPHVDECRRCNS